MTVAFDAFTANANQTADHNFNHTPVGTPRAVIVWVVERAATADHIAGITYGGDAMTEVSGSPAIIASGETGVVYCYFLGTSIPTGVQSVSVDTTATSNYITYCVTLTAANDCTVQDSDGTIASVQANPSVTLSLSGKTSWAGLALHSGQQTVGGITPLTNWTSRSETDRGTDQAACYTYDTIASTDVSAGWTQTSEEALAVCIAVTDVTASLFERTINENAITVADTLSKVAIKPRSVSETITVADTLSRMASKFRTISETITISEVLSKSALKFVTITENSVLTSDTIQSFRILPRVINENAITLADTLNRMLTANRSMSETVTVSDTLSKIAYKFRTMSETITVADVLSKVKSLFRSMSETITVSDSLSKLRTVLKSMSESIIVSDSITKVRTVFRTINENAITTIDQVVREFIAGGGDLFERVINESITVSDSVTKMASKFRTMSESVTVSDSLSKIATKFRSMSESITLTDSINKLRTAIKSISESITISDSISKTALKFRTMTEGITIQDVVDRLLIGPGGTLFAVVINESITVSDSIGSLFTKFIHKIGGRPPGGNIFRRRYEQARKKWSPDWRKKLNKRIGIE